MSRTNPFVLIVLDGWGERAAREGNAIAQARTPHFDAIAKEWPHTTVKAAELAVGLPEGQPGNSEVGHQNIGAGRRVLQDYVKINEAIADGTFYTNDALLAAVKHVAAHNSQLHICGLLGDGGVHSHQKHLEALLSLAHKRQVERVFIHCFMDGRDTSPTSGLGFMQQLLHSIDSLGDDIPRPAIATVIGRYYAMDRDNRWERVAAAYQAMVSGKGQHAASPLDAIQASYDAGITDEFMLPTVITDDDRPVAVIRPGDAVIHFNFRPDRARQLTAALTASGLTTEAINALHAGPIKDLLTVTMTTYQDGLPVQVAYPGGQVPMPLAEAIARRGLTQFHTAETEKYAHVTYFINGRREEPFEGEDRLLVPSPKVATYDLQPAMSAAAVTDAAIEALQTKKYDLIIMNYANGDMVGHTGVFDATVKAVEVVDAEVGRMIEATLAAGGNALITADHGKAEEMLDEVGKPLTAHTLNPVPVYFIVPALKHTALRTDGILADIAPTVLAVMGIEQPDEMSGTSLS